MPFGWKGGKMPSEFQKQNRNKSLKTIVMESLKWGFTIWCVMPLITVIDKPSGFYRVLLGILLFIIFSGKLFYDVIISEFVRQKRNTVTQDLLMLVGMIAFVLIFIGMVVFMIIVAVMQYTAAPEPDYPM